MYRKPKCSTVQDDPVNFCLSGPYVSGLPSLDHIDLVVNIDLFRGGCFVHYRMFNTIHGLFSLDTSSTPTILISVVTNKMSLDIIRCSLAGGGWGLPQLRMIDVHQAEFQIVLDEYLTRENADDILLIF